jgi:hypothetical protein
MGAFKSEILLASSCSHPGGFLGHFLTAVKFVTVSGSTGDAPLLPADEWTAAGVSACPSGRSVLPSASEEIRLSSSVVRRWSSSHHAGRHDIRETVCAYQWKVKLGKIKLFPQILLNLVYKSTSPNYDTMKK